MPRGIGYGGKTRRKGKAPTAAAAPAARPATKGSTMSASRNKGQRGDLMKAAAATRKATGPAPAASTATPSTMKARTHPSPTAAPARRAPIAGLQAPKAVVSGGRTSGGQAVPAAGSGPLPDWATGKELYQRTSSTVSSRRR